jgi:hypothetical protein
MEHPLHDAKIIERFWAKVDMPEDPTSLLACWIWQGSIDSKPEPYGVAFDGTRKRPAHVLAWEIYYCEPVPRGVLVRHVVCRDRLCVRPDHLAMGSHADNMADMVRDGRSRRGEANGNAAFTREDIRAIRGSTERAVDLAAKYGVRPGTITNIRKRRTWAWLD